MSETMFWEYVENMLKAEDNSTYYPRLTSICPDADIDTAYRLQEELTRRKLARGEKIAGYKQACSSHFQQHTFNTPKPVVAHLYEKGRCNGTLKITRPGIIMESEFVYILGRDIDTWPQSVAEMKAAVEKVCCGMEFPFVSFEDNTGLNAVDIIPNDTGGFGFLVGPELTDWDNLSTLPVRFSKNGEELYLGHGSDAGGGQWENLLTFVHNLLEHKYPLQKGMILFSGSVGKLTDALPGDYVADFGGTCISYKVENP